MKNKYIISICAAILVMSSCGTGKSVTGNGKTVTNVHVNNAQSSNLSFLRKVSDNALYQKDVVSKMTFSINTGTKEISVPGSIHMRKDDVIRLQLFVPILGTEVGRLEFTKDYVMIVDRIHKQYIKADYNKVDFLRDKGLSFYSLQALFWNCLFMPGEQKVGDEQLEKFTVNLGSEGTAIPVSLKQGNMEFVWTADKESGSINSADITYKSGNTGTSRLNWKYSDFRAFGSRKYPNNQKIYLVTNAAGNKKREVTVTFEMSGVSADSNWETRTEVSNKYKQVSVEDVLKKIMSL